MKRQRDFYFLTVSRLHLWKKLRCPTADEEQDYSDEDEYTDASDLLDDESEECEQMLEERKAIFSILQNRKKNIGARLKRLLLQLPYADEMLLLTVQSWSGTIQNLFEIRL